MGRLSRQSPMDGHPLRLIAPEVIGTPIEELLRHDIWDLESFEPSRPFSKVDLDHVQRHRIVPLVRSDWVDRGLVSEFRKDQRSVAVVQLKLLAELNRVLELFEQEGIESRVLKGLATGDLDYPRPGMRQTGDIDLLVDPDDLQMVDEVLVGGGELRRQRFARHFDPYLNRGMTYVGRAGVEVDVHTQLTAYGQQDIRQLMRNGQRLKALPGFALRPELRVLHAAGHVFWSPYGTRRLSGLVDVLVTLEPAEAPTVVAEAQAGGLELAFETMRVVEELRGTATPTSWPGLSRSDRRTWLAERRRPVCERVHALARTDGVRAKWRRAVEMVPKRSYIEDRGGMRQYGRRVRALLRA